MIRRRTIHARRRTGFTLIEVLATIALLAIVLPVAMQGVSIATGIGIGFITYAALKLLARRAAEVSGAVWLIAALCIAKFGLA